MKDNFALAVENSTASFVNFNKLLCGNSHEVIPAQIGLHEKTVILCHDSGWFEAGREIKENLKGEKTCFCIDDIPEFEKGATLLLDSVKDINYLVVIGSEELAIFAVNYCADKQIKIIYTPLDTCFSQYFLQLVNCENLYLALDGTRLNKVGKNRLTDGVRSVLSKKILLVEMRANEYIAGLSPSNEAKILLETALKNLNAYLSNHLIENLVCAILLSCLAEVKAGAGNVARSATNVLLKIQKLSLKGEAEYLLYKMVLRAYALYFKNDTSFTLKLPGVVIEEEQLNDLFSGNGKIIPYIPPFFNKLQEVERIKKEIVEKGNIVEIINEQISQIENDEIILKKEYGGRKYSVEHYNAKQRSTALLLAPYLTDKPCAYHLLFASGFTQYLK